MTGAKKKAKANKKAKAKKTSKADDLLAKLAELKPPDPYICDDALK